MQETRRLLLAGGFPAWPLPMDSHGAAFARKTVGQLGEALGLPDQQTYDLTVAVSELAANVHLHAPVGTVPPELWAYLRWDPRPELVIKVYDSAPWDGELPTGNRPPSSAVGGRGFEVIAALIAEYGGTWGLHPTSSRLAATPAQGKVVHLSIALPATLAPQPTHHPAARLHDLLESRRLGRLQVNYGEGMAVYCVRADVHAWFRGTDILASVLGDQYWLTTRFSLYDVVEAAEFLAMHASR
jgi:hypothetical protein